MRLLIVTDAWEPQVNGVVRTYQNIVRELRAMGHIVEVIGPDRFISTPMPGYAEIRLSLFPRRKLIRLIEAFKPDSIHIPVEGILGWDARGYCLKHGIRFTTSFHTQFPEYVAARVPFGKNFMRNLAIKFVRTFHRPAKATFVATPSLEAQLHDWNFKQPMVRLLRGVDFNVFHAGHPTLFRHLPGPIQLYVGRVSVEKNLEAFLSLNTPGTKVVVGHGPDLEILKRRYRDVIFTGVQTGEALAAHYRSADVFVFPSRSDTFGMVLIEAMACGLPIAGYDVIGPRDIVTVPILGAIGDDLSVAIQKALQAPGSKDERMAYAQSFYSWPSVAQTFLETAQKRAL